MLACVRQFALYPCLRVCVVQGEEILTSYGLRSNEVFLKQYGFAVPFSNDEFFIIGVRVWRWQTLAVFEGVKGVFYFVMSRSFWVFLGRKARRYSD